MAALKFWNGTTWVEVAADGAPGADGADGVGVPAGGTTGQALVKASSTDFDTEWADVSGGSGGLSQQQVLGKIWFYS